MVGVDLRQGMIDKAEERTRRLGVEHLVELRVADAKDLPFEDGLFDAVISESVAVFLEDKAQGIGGYARVTRPGGYVGCNEMTWMKEDPPSALVEYYFRTTGARPDCMATSNWLL